MKKIFTFLISFLSIFNFAQLDSEHWFAPMSAAAGASNLESLLYLSTNETAPFTVEIYNNNTLYNTVQISKGSPQFISIPGYFMIASTPSEVHTVGQKGMYVKGPKKFFANYRFTVTNHGEIITSKGLAGLGNEFLVAMAPNSTSQSYVNSTVGFLATEDNTTITISDYNPNVIFSDGSTADSRTFTLNKGQSYILEALSQTTTANLAGLIGAKVVSDKPITMTNGNFNGIYSTQNLTNNDILMDQSVPLQRLGKDFVVVKGNGPVTTDVEQVLVIASEDNTQLTVNGTPYGSILNKGDYTMLPSTLYVNPASNHYNMSISATNNIYVYELLAGTSLGNVYPTGGFNFIPPLSCFLPNKVDEIGFINQIGNNYYQTKLNIITEAGATVTLNGSALAANNGPFTVQGNPNWVTYSVPNVSGTIYVNSTKSVTAGIAAGSGAIGYGGYFAGFSSVPVISKTGDCYNGIQLQVDDSYDAYQWYFNGSPLTGETDYFINPETYGAGSYTVLITKTNCSSKLTEAYNYTVCPPLTQNNYSIGSCNTLMITPAFGSSTQTIDPSKTTILANPTNGTASINTTTGVITYTPNSTLTADFNDTFVYVIKGNGNPADEEFIRANITVDVLQTNNATLQSCATTSNGQAFFDLTSTNLTPDAGTTITYYEDSNLSTPINTPNNYLSSASTVYANITSSFGCSKVATIGLQILPTPNVDTSNFSGGFCDDNFDGSVTVNLTDVGNQIVNNAGQFNIRFYENQADANAGNANNLGNNYTYSSNTTLYVRVDSTTGACPTAFGQISLFIKAPVNLSPNESIVTLCDADRDGSISFSISDYASNFTTATNLTTTYYNTLSDAQNSTNNITSSQTINSPKTYYIRFEGNGVCPAIGKLDILISTPNQSNVLKDKVICPNAMTELDAGTGFDSYLWSTGDNTQMVTVGVGNYYVDLTSNGCTYRQFVKVTEQEVVEITGLEIIGNSVTVNVKGGVPPYQYSLDDYNYQPSNIFSNLPRGNYTVYVQSSDGCASASKDFLILNLINTITPNDDGINDYLDYSDLRTKEDVSITIYDRYGGIIFKNKPNEFTWDGSLNGSPVSTDSYWYTLEWTEPISKERVKYDGWIMVKNRN